MVASTSAFISTTDLPCPNASRMTCAPNSTEPVTSTTTSISLGAADQERVLGDDRDAPADRVVELRLRLGHGDVVAARVPVDVLRALGPAVVDRRHPHARNAVADLVGEALAHEPGADHADADRLALPLPRLQCVVDDDHASSGRTVPLCCEPRSAADRSSCASAPARSRRAAPNARPSARSRRPAAAMSRPSRGSS